jgi:hypothetical protein
MVEKLSFKNLRARMEKRRQSSSVEEMVENILKAETRMWLREGNSIRISYPQWFADAVSEKDVSDEECEAIVEAVFLVLSDVLWEHLTDELEKFRGKQEN